MLDLLSQQSVALDFSSSLWQWAVGIEISEVRILWSASTVFISLSCELTRFKGNTLGFGRLDDTVQRLGKGDLDIRRREGYDPTTMTMYRSAWSKDTFELGEQDDLHSLDFAWEDRCSSSIFSAIDLSAFKLLTVPAIHEA